LVQTDRLGDQLHFHFFGLAGTAILRWNKHYTYVWTKTAIIIGQNVQRWM
jgi:hypothetical protein